MNGVGLLIVLGTYGGWREQQDNVFQGLLEGDMGGFGMGCIVN